MRFDAVYYGHFKCNAPALVDYRNLWGFARDLYQTPGVADTVHIDYIKMHYYGSHASINPTGIIPAGPDIDFASPHHRDPLEQSGGRGQAPISSEAGRPKHRGGNRCLTPLRFTACRRDSRRRPAGSLASVFITNGP